MSEELVYVVPRAAIMGNETWRGVRTESLDSALAAIHTGGRMEPRTLMEGDPSFKQIIPYLVLREGERYFLMRRTKLGGDARLHDLYSIGVGGHINPGDGGLEGGLIREWHEELVASFDPVFRLVGLLNDDETDVGSVHLGVVFEADAEGRPIEVRETHKLSGAFAAPSEVDAVRELMESWSQLVFDHMEQTNAVR